jgi:hypothetical protein
MNVKAISQVSKQIGFPLRLGNRYWRVAQPLRLNFRVADPSVLFEGSEGLARGPETK